MPVDRDPEGVELVWLRRLVDLAGKRVLEIGAGDGRLTRHYAVFAGMAAVVDLNEVVLSTLLTDRPAELRHTVFPAAASAEALPFPRAVFDTAIFAWSL